jgi:hypothetical protein
MTDMSADNMNEQYQWLLLKPKNKTSYGCFITEDSGQFPVARYLYALDT